MPFRTQSSIFAVCSFCKSTLVRQDKDLNLVGKMADLPYDISPLQVGTTGYYQDRKFELVGRLRVAYPDGYWNEWYALFASDHVGWLAEAQGFYALCTPFEGDTSNLPPKFDLRPGQPVDLSPVALFSITDIRRAVCIYSEGELPMQAAEGRASISVDLLAPDERMATIEYADDETRVFTGKYVDFDDFKFQNLREIDGW